MKTFAQASIARDEIKKSNPLRHPPTDIRSLMSHIIPFTMVSIIALPAHVACGLLRSFPRPISPLSSHQTHEVPLYFSLTCCGGIAIVGCVSFAGLWYLWFSVPRKFMVSDRWVPARVTLHEITLCYVLLALGFVWVAFSTSLPFYVLYWIIRTRIANE